MEVTLLLYCLCVYLYAVVWNLINEYLNSAIKESVTLGLRE